MAVNPLRIRQLNTCSEIYGPVVYWMNRDQRTSDNWALLYAQEKALVMKTPLLVVFCLAPSFLEATSRQYDFMLRGLFEVDRRLAEYNIPFCLLSGNPADEISTFCQKIRCGCLITDFSPLKIIRAWKKDVSAKLPVPLYEVDAHNIVPCFIASSKQEIAAHTLRPKLRRQIEIFFETFPTLLRHPIFENIVSPEIWTDTKWDLAISSISRLTKISAITNILPGESAAKGSLHFFLERGGLFDYVKCNDPNSGTRSHLSPWLHFGHLAPQRVALEAARNVDESSAFLEELVTRREIAENYCYYNDNYDNPAGFPAWAINSLEKHAQDPHPAIYNTKELENASTHDPLWNAAQMEMSKTGYMHGYLRMYWAKKMLEWSCSPVEAQGKAIYLNDKYLLDGRDPNGYTGIAWCMGAVHDRPFPERDIFGKIRYMTLGGCRRKFDVDAYIRRITSL